jgi:hypothetical protein
MAAVALVRSRTETASGNGVDMEGESNALPGCRERRLRRVCPVFFVGDGAGHGAGSGLPVGLSLHRKNAPATNREGTRNRFAKLGQRHRADRDAHGDEAVLPGQIAAAPVVRSG